MFELKVENKSLVIQIDDFMRDSLVVPDKDVYVTLCGSVIALEFCLDMMMAANDVCAIDTWAEWEEKYKRVKECIRNMERYTELTRAHKAKTMTLVGEDFDIIRQGITKYHTLDKKPCTHRERDTWRHIYEGKRIIFYRCKSCGLVQATRKL